MTSLVASLARFLCPPLAPIMWPREVIPKALCFGYPYVLIANVPGPNEAFLGLICISVLLGNRYLNDFLLTTDLKGFPNETSVFPLSDHTGFLYSCKKAIMLSWYKLLFWPLTLTDIKLYLSTIPVNLHISTFIPTQLEPPKINELLSTAEQKYFNPLQMKGKIPQPKSLLLRGKLKEFILHLVSSAKPQYSWVIPESCISAACAALRANCL